MTAAIVKRGKDWAKKQNKNKTKQKQNKNKIQQGFAVYSDKTNLVAILQSNQWKLAIASA